VSQQINAIVMAMAGASRVFELLDTEPEYDEGYVMLVNAKEENGELTESRPPLVLGVTVVCSGGDSDHVRARLTEMITALFDIPSNRVAVLKSG
jgi:stage III sporulation protein AG